MTKPRAGPPERSTSEKWVGTGWVVWPDKYAAWLEATKEKPRQTPGMRAGGDGVESVRPVTGCRKGTCGHKLRQPPSGLQARSTTRCRQHLRSWTAPMPWLYCARRPRLWRWVNPPGSACPWHRALARKT